MGPDAMFLVPWMLSFKPDFSLSSFTFIQRLFSSSLLSAIRLVSSAYLRLLIFLLVILIPACASSSLAFCMRYSAHRLSKQGDNIQPWRTSFPIWDQFVVPCLVLPAASWPAYTFLRRQVRWSGIPFLPEFSTVCGDPQPKALVQSTVQYLGSQRVRHDSVIEQGQLTFRSLIHFEFIFVYGFKECSNFILLHVAIQLSQQHLLKSPSFLHL